MHSQGVIFDGGKEFVEVSRIMLSVSVNGDYMGGAKTARFICTSFDGRSLALVVLMHPDLNRQIIYHIHPLVCAAIVHHEHIRVYCQDLADNFPKGGAVIIHRDNNENLDLFRSQYFLPVTG